MVLRCELCPKHCLVAPGQSGDCRVRVNIDGALRAVTYGFASAAHVDPVEKKPLNHFLPGSSIFSIATVGCNLHCKNCQNWELSQRNPEDASAFPLPPAAVVARARRYGCPSIAYTYTDPSVYYEYTLDTCKAARAAGLRNVLVTAGYLNEAPLRELCRYVDAVTVDIKAMSDAFYREICDATLAPVLNYLAVCKSLGVHVEISNLVIPTLNDADEDIARLCRWIRETLGAETPLHFLGFFPRYRMRHLPPTPAATLARARRVAVGAGLDYVYVGNVLVADSARTRCPACRGTVVERVGYRVVRNAAAADGACPHCGRRIYGVWK
jgi:pyruvate formate lyase activating enzyme